ncbi:DEAD/DEAH box helicase [Thermobifida halotolerans]|uniref:DEAD/DEAH box helicase n=2 Tax=Thermobifida halotolerans TaxID=483545 RepID=A0AA97M6C6_9ACTN|nr:DEAD/DEAH box helicase [Thermobifida halotolerans]
MSEEEVLNAIEHALSSTPGSPRDLFPEDVRDLLIRQGLLFRVPGESSSYRTRFAEALRLTVHLRQLFPRWRREGPPANWWRSGRRLVADYRLHVAPRRYPRRDVPASTALEEFAQLDGWGSLQEQVAAAQISDYSLARFQVRATEAIFDSLARRQSRGVIIGAGTGSGKTLAFYLPAFAAMSAETHRRQVHTLALYPRTELLRDQLRDAVAAALKVNPLLVGEKRRPLRIGVLYSSTPYSARSLDSSQASSQGWRRLRTGLVCPYLTCPACSNGALVWSAQDWKAQVERLHCQDCGLQLPEDLLALTRDSLQRHPPDLLFTTTEMLNRHSTNPSLAPLLGWSGRARPSLVLLDEVHIQSGPQGAQVALLLRRWRHAVRQPVTFVGLSATLKDARRFFAQLTGLPETDVDYIEPAPDTMVQEGREYSLALRGDPLSGASLLSTSLQVSMLFGRILDRQTSNRRPNSLFGSTGFLFTDDLDVTNRFYNDLRDAEGGQTRRGHTRGRAVLAALRSPDLPQRAERYQEGQSWELVERIGRHLSPDLHAQELRIGRTSSQDAGVNLDADLTVATASLEVGFNDPSVGLVLQHKAPRDAAAFIQRRGRAGRIRGTRPITVITLSDYGRDRLAYQGYETLFSPEVSPRNLPVGNRYVVKIQAAQALLDWLGRDLQRQHRVDPRALLNGMRARQLDPANYRRAREWLVKRLRGLLEDKEGLRDSLARHVQNALQLSADATQAVLWEQPRSLMLSVVPTALRRLQSNWQSLRRDPAAERDSVLPEFITRSLFEPLNVPEVEFDLPFEAEPESLPVERALREAVPGRVSRRYGYRRDDHRTWLPLPVDGQQTLQIDALAPDSSGQGEWLPYGPHQQRLRVFRPFRIKLQTPPEDVSDHSQGRPLWGSQIIASEATPPHEAEVPRVLPWKERVQSVGFATHAAGNPIEVRRMTYGADCEISRTGSQSSERRTVRYAHGDTPAAFGYRLEVDALRLRVAPLDLSQPTVRAYLASPAWRSKAYFRALAEDPELTKVANSFQRDWLALVYLTAFSLEGLDGSRTPQQIHATLADGSWRERLPEILKVLYREEASENRPSVDAEQAPADRLINALTEVSNNQVVLDALNRASQLLVADDVAERTAELACRAYWDTLASAVLQACLLACPDAQDSDLIVDVLPTLEPGGSATIWLSESSAGGLGVMEYLVEYYSQDPRRFWTLVSAVLRPNEYEYTDATLTRLLEYVVQEEPSGEASVTMELLRSAGSASDADRALTRLRTAWADLDGPPRHSAIAALSTRLLRPGSDRRTDAFALRLVTEWTALEQRLGFEVDSRVIAYAVGSGRLRLDGGLNLAADQVFSLLWPRGDRARNHHLEYYQPFGNANRPTVLDRMLAEAAHDEQLPRITVTEAGWEERYRRAIADARAVELICPTSERAALSEALLRVPALSVDLDVLRVYGDVISINRYGREFRCRVELLETEQ